MSSARAVFLLHLLAVLAGVVYCVVLALLGR